MADVLFRISGYAAWAQVPWVIWAIVRERKDPALRQFLALKNNTIPGVDLTDAQFSFRIPKGVDHIDVAVDEEPSSAAEALAPEPPEDAKERRGKLKTAVEFLEILKGDLGDQKDSMPAKEIQATFPKINPNTWKQARRELGILTGQRSAGWFWKFFPVPEQNKY